MPWTQLGPALQSEQLGAPIISDGSDGSVTFDGTSVILGLTPSSTVYTLTRDIWPDNLTVNSGVTIKTAGFCIYVKQTLTNLGTIQFNGNDGSGSTAGAAHTAQGTLNTQAGAGGAGRATTGAGSNGGGSGGNNVPGASSGAGGTAGGANTGGTANASAAPVATAGSIRDISFGNRRRLQSANLLLSPNGGGGGGGGGCDTGTGTATSGGGGGGACGVLISCTTLQNTGTISANGGAGAAGVATGNGIAGGGGGGPGGWIWIAVRRITSLGTVTASGGTGGAGAGGGASGGNGTAGLVIVLTGN